ncbi:MAG: NAD-dependent epimerase/dehydratase family protein [Verrucomicrobiales bacterium]
MEALLRRGERKLRCLVRQRSGAGRLEDAFGRHGAVGQAEIVQGDLLSMGDCRKIAAGASTVVHLAAGMDKSFAGAYMNSALATRNLIEAFLEFGELGGRFVLVSSFAVYSPLGEKRGEVLDEACPLEDRPMERNDAYGFGKLQQEEMVKEYGRTRGLKYVLLRPGAVFGPGKPALTGRVAIGTFGFPIHLGGTNRIPFTYVENCAEAIALAAVTPGIDGAIMNVVDDDVPTSREFFREYKRATGKRFSLSVPYPVTAAGCRLWEWYSRKSGGQLPPVFNRRRCAAEWGGHRYSNQCLKDTLGWKPTVPMREAMDRYFAALAEKRATM